VSQRHHENEKVLVVDLVDDPVIAGPHAPLTAATNKPFCRSRTRISTKELNRSLDTPACDRV